MARTPKERLQPPRSRRRGRRREDGRTCMLLLRWVGGARRPIHLPFEDARRPAGMQRKAHPGAENAKGMSRCAVQCAPTTAEGLTITAPALIRSPGNRKRVTNQAGGEGTGPAWWSRAKASAV